MNGGSEKEGKDREGSGEREKEEGVKEVVWPKWHEKSVGISCLLIYIYMQREFIKLDNHRLILSFG